MALDGVSVITRDLLHSIVSYPWYFLSALSRPGSFVRTRVSPQAVGTFLTISTILSALLGRQIERLIPAFVSTEGAQKTGAAQTRFLVLWLSDWRRVHDGPLVSGLDVWTWTAIFLLMPTLFAMSATLCALQWPERRAYRSLFRQASIPLAVVVVALLGASLTFWLACASPSVPLALAGAAWGLSAGMQAYAAYVVVATTRALGSLSWTRTLVSSAIFTVLCGFAIPTVLSGSPTTRDAALDGLVDSIAVEAHEATLKDREDQAVLLLQSPDVEGSIKAAALLARAHYGTVYNAFALAHRRIEQGSEAGSALTETRARFSRFATALDSLASKFPDVPALQLRLGLYNSYFGRCEAAIQCYRTAFGDTRSTPLEKLRAGLRLRCLGASNEGLGRLLTTFPPDSELGSLRLTATSPFFLHLMMDGTSVSRGGFLASGWQLIDDSLSEVSQLNRLNHAEAAMCRCDPKGWGRDIAESAQTALSATP